MDSGDFGGFDIFFGGDKPGGHRPTTAGERTVIAWLARLASLLLIGTGLIGAVFTSEPESIPGFLIIAGAGVGGLVVIWGLRRIGLI